MHGTGGFFIGRHNSGKTTILEKVVSYFCAQVIA